MKTFFRMILSTCVAAAVLFGLYGCYGYLQEQSMLGTTIDTVLYGCLAALALVTVVLYLRCWFYMFRDAFHPPEKEGQVSQTQESHDAAEVASFVTRQREPVPRKKPEEPKPKTGRHTVKKVPTLSSRRKKALAQAELTAALSDEADDDEEEPFVKS